MSSWWANRNFRIAAILVAALLALLLVFCVGLFIGLGALRPFGGPGLFRFFRPDRGHGAVGTVTAVQGNTITATNAEGQTLTVVVAPTTVIDVGLRRRGQLQDIHVGDRIIVIGVPGSGGAILARFIRVVHNQPMSLN